MAAIAKPFTQPSDAPPAIGVWCQLLLDHLEEFTTLAWYLVADGALVEEAFARMMVQLDAIPFEASIPQLAHNQVREILITEAIGVLEEAQRNGDRNHVFKPGFPGDLPDLPRLAFMLRLVIRSSETEVAKFLKITPFEARNLVKRAIHSLSQSVPAALPEAQYEA